MSTVEQSNIRSVENFQEGFWEWAPYNDCFLSASGMQTGIRISDIDGHVERNGHFLWVETTRNTQISLGQLRSIKHRVSRGDTVIILHGSVNSPQEIEVYKPHASLPTRRPCNEKIVKHFMRGWMLWAEANGWVQP